MKVSIAASIRAGISIGSEWVVPGQSSARTSGTRAWATRSVAAEAGISVGRIQHSRAVPTTEGFRIGTTVWFAYLAMSVGDPEIARLVAEAKRGQEQVAVRLLTAAAAAGLVRRSLDPEPVARRLIATADGLAMRVLTGELPAAEALELLEGDLTALGGRRRPAGGGGRRATPRPPA